jgi:molybdopterin converting factor subunit 1
MPKEKSVEIRYFALLREERGLSEETIKTEAETLQELFIELKSRHGFSLAIGSLNVSVNEEFKPWHTQLQERDSVVFIPPVAGG